jgi:hypothetical protein
LSGGTTPARHRPLYRTRSSGDEPSGRAMNGVMEEREAASATPGPSP